MHQNDTVRTAPLLELKNVSKYYGEPESRILVLDRISFSIREAEFVALLGQSGSGKSTLLRIITGLATPSTGEVLYRGERIKGINPYASIIFQTFALYPWFTALENVELVLKAKGFRPDQRRQRAEALLDMVGLDGFEDAYPRELSGGERQKVGFARALAAEPELLCMDEPFSALDVLSAETLRGELLELWQGRKLTTKAILMVTHNIEEAVFLADRAIVLSKNPGRVVADFPIRIAHPRDRRSREFAAIVDRIYRIITKAVPLPPPPEAEIAAVPLPHAPLVAVAGLVERVLEEQGQRDLYRLAEDFNMEVDDLLPVTAAAERLRLGQIREGDFILTSLGKEFAQADVLKRKEMLRDEIAQVPLIRHILTVLETTRDKAMPEEFFLEELRHSFSEEEARAQLETAIDWGRYAEIFTYDHDSRELYIEQ